MKTCYTKLYYCSVTLIVICGMFSACDDGATGNKPGDTDGDSDILIDGDTWDAVHADGDVDIADIMENHDDPHIDGDDADAVDDPVCLPEVDAPAVVDFVVVQMGHSATRDIVIRNTGCGDLLLISVLLNGSSHSFAGEFGLLEIPANDEVPVIIAPGESFEFTATYAPMDAGEDEAVVSVQTNVPGKEVIEIRLISHAPPSRLCFRVLDGNPRDLDDNILEMGEVEPDAASSRIIRIWDCAPEDIGGRVYINALEIEQEYDMFAAEFSIPNIPFSLEPVGMNMPGGFCENTRVCTDLVVKYRPEPWRYGMEDQDVAKIQVTYDSSAGNDQVFDFSAVGEISNSGLYVIPLEPGCTGVRYDQSYYLGYVIRNYTLQEYLITKAENFIPLGSDTPPNIFTMHRGVDNVILVPGEEYLLVVKYTPYQFYHPADEWEDDFIIRVSYCDTANDGCYAGNPNISIVSSRLNSHSTCLAQTEPDNGNWPPQAVVNASCNMETTFWANVPDDTENCGYEWSWLEQPEGSMPSIEATSLVNPEGYWESVRVTPDKAGFYLLTEQKMNCNSGILQYIGLVAMQVDCEAN